MEIFKIVNLFFLICEISARVSWDTIKKFELKGKQSEFLKILIDIFGYLLSR